MTYPKALIELYCYFLEVSIIPLETSDEILLGSVDDLLFSDRYIFVLDRVKS
ncbi:6-bladed beta-propeller [Lunatibacter salilacus]|uniref:6-bladed beta-propeller n=1 Tax=Lunatibacter salilacus TaxID=2483804 RepID=UPI00131BE62B